jgi:hypothetical protein
MKMLVTYSRFYYFNGNLHRQILLQDYQISVHFLDLANSRVGDLRLQQAAGLVMARFVGKILWDSTVRHQALTATDSEEWRSPGLEIHPHLWCQIECCSADSAVLRQVLHLECSQLRQLH